MDEITHTEEKLRKARGSWLITAYLEIKDKVERGFDNNNPDPELEANDQEYAKFALPLLEVELDRRIPPRD